MKDYVIVSIIFVAACMFAIPASAIWTYPPIGEITGCVDAVGYPKSNAFDGNDTSYWASDGGCGYLQWNVSHNISSVKIKAHNPGSTWPFSISDSAGSLGGATIADDGVYHEIVFSHPSVDYVRVTGGSWGNHREMEYNISASWFSPPIANFTASATNGTAPAYISFTDTSENEYGTCTYNWSIAPTGGVAGYIGSAENHAASFTVNGNYTVSHGVSCDAGSNISTKTDYIHIANSSDLVLAYVSAIDQINGYRILGSTINIQDVENASWSNSTADPDGIHSISTVYGHHLNAYGSAFGYSPGENLGISNIFDGVDYAVYMTNSNTSPASSGNVTLNIRVEDGNSLQPIAGAAVSGVPSGAGAGFNIMTDSQGIVNIVVPNKTTYAISATKTNYVMSIKNVYTGTAPGPGAVVSEFILLYPSTVTQPPSVTQTTLPGGGTPQPTQTYYKYCDPALPDYNEDACRTSENTGMMDQLREAGPSIIALCILAILMGLLKIIMG